MKFPKDAPQRKVIKTFEALGFKVVRVGNHISMIKENPDGSNTPLTMPNHETIKVSTPVQNSPIIAVEISPALFINSPRFFHAYS